ncbi:MAG TPA: hypothetical protein HPP76_11575 [Desulfuromonadales bacterium]|nr:hypothetical protein [Desulfuromonadales bacterium]
MKPDTTQTVKSLLALALLMSLIVGCGGKSGDSGAAASKGNDTGTATDAGTIVLESIQSSLKLASSFAVDGGLLPVEYTCDGTGVSPALSWLGAPAGTKEFALMMTTLPGDGTTKYQGGGK